MTQDGVNVKYVRLDNAGENVAFAQLANGREWNLRLTFEFTGARTPQRNYLVEVGFATLWGRLQATFDAAMVPEEEKYKLVREGIHHLTFLDGLIVRGLDGVKTRYGHVYGDDPKVKMPMRTWGEGGYVKTIGKVKSKLEMRGAAAMFVGYAEQSAPDTYRMYAPETNSIHVTRDVQWTKKMHYAPNKTDQVHAVDSVDMIINKAKVPLRTTERVTVDEAQDQAAGKGPVQFKGEVDIIEAVDYDDEDEEEERPTAYGAGGQFGKAMCVEVDHTQQEEMSTISSSMDKVTKIHVHMPMRVRAEREEAEVKADEEDEAKSALVERDAAETEWPEEDGESEKADDDEDEGKLDEAEDGDDRDERSIDYESGVDSQDYSSDEEDEVEYEDDSAFFERLLNTSVLAEMQNRDGHFGQGEDDSDGDEQEQAVGVRKSGRVIQPPKRLIEEMSGLSVDNKGAETTWSEFIRQLCEVAMVGAGIGGGFNHTSELNVKNYNKAMRTSDMEEMAKWIKGMDEEHARFLENEVWLAVLKEDHKGVVGVEDEGEWCG